MAAPTILQTMWLFLVSAASTAVDVRSAQREFPQLANVVYSICGLSDIDFSVSHPCAYAIFGMAYAFTECGHVHQADYSNFESCIAGCNTGDNCVRACADPDVKSDNCMADCTTVANCIKKVASSASGQASAKTDLDECFSDKAPVVPAAAVVALQIDAASPAPSPSASPSASPSGSPGPAPGPVAVIEAITTTLSAIVSAGATSIPVAAQAGFVEGAKIIIGAGTQQQESNVIVGFGSILLQHPLKYSHPAGVKVSMQVDPGFTMREAVVSNSLGFVDAKCMCSKTGIIRGVTTGQPGCAKHGKEANAHVEAYCYVEGDYKCGGAMSSDLHAGLFWVGCEKPNIHLLYPVTCEIRERANAALWPVPPSLPLKVPAVTFEGSLKNMAPLPRAPSPLDDMFHGMHEWDGPLPPLWHAARSNYFTNEAFQNPAPEPPPAMVFGAAPAMAPPSAPMYGPPMMLAPPNGISSAPAMAPPPAPAVALVEEVASSVAGAGQLRGVRQH